MAQRVSPLLRNPARTEPSEDGRALRMIWEAEDGTGRIVQLSTSHFKSSKSFRSTLLPAVETTTEEPTTTPGVVSLTRSTAYSVGLMDSVDLCSTPAPRFSQKALSAAANAALDALQGAVATNRTVQEWFSVIGPVFILD